MALKSLRMQLLAWLLIPLAGVVLVNTWIAYRNAQLTAGLVTDHTLLASARSIAEQVKIGDNLVEATVPPAALGMFASESRDRVYYRITGPDGDLLAGYPDLPAPPRPIHDQQPHYFDIRFRSEPIRLVAVLQPIFVDGTTRGVLVVIGETLRAREAMVDDLWVENFRQQALLVLVAAVLAWLGLKRGLAPLLRLRDAVLERKPNEFRPFSVASVQSELQPLVAVLNEYMARLQRQLEARRRFTANAAHQLRTPLALLRTQASYAARAKGEADNDEALKGILDTTRQMTRLTNQLLTLSKAESDGRMPHREPVDLTELARQVLEDLAGLALAREIDLGFEAPESNVVTVGDPTMLRELLVNLVDNALRYTPMGGVVTVAVGRDGDSCLLRVEDDGPGIPAAERTRVFERFYRVLGTEAEGSGLGLAIVREIVNAVGGTVALGDPLRGAGLLVEVRLPSLGSEH